MTGSAGEEKEGKRPRQILQFSEGPLVNVLVIFDEQSQILLELDLTKSENTQFKQMRQRSTLHIQFLFSS